VSSFTRRTSGTVLLAVCISCGGCQISGLLEDVAIGPVLSPSSTQGEENELIIQNEPLLPETYPHADYQVHLAANGGVHPLHWRVEKGALPAGIELEDNGLLHGIPERQGEFQFTVGVRDSANPPRAVQKEFIIRVHAALTLVWKTPAHVNGNRIEGNVLISNTTADDMDLTFIVLAVAANGRATAIGYQHFSLLKNTIEKELPFGETLPRGGYVVHLDAVGEVAPKNVIYRERLETPGPLEVPVGP
jgi:hypothetical protein